MKKTLDIKKNSLNSYIDNNRVKIDEALVSLRLMKEIDDFLEINDIKHRDFAVKMGYSEAFISQLMSGTKKFNTSFINRIEKTFDLKVDFKIKTKNDIEFISKYTNSSIIIYIDKFNPVESEETIALESNPSDYSIFNSN